MNICKTIECRTDCQYYFGNVEGLRQFGSIVNLQRIFCFGNPAGGPVFIIEAKNADGAHA